jgi:hypothetical protein
VTRNTHAAGARRNTRASAQLEAFPPSANAALRQSPRHKAVVSIRLTGDTIAKLDAEAKRLTDNGDKVGRRGHWYGGLTRSDIIERAITAYFTPKKGKPK